MPVVNHAPCAVSANALTDVFIDTTPTANAVAFPAACTQPCTAVDLSSTANKVMFKFKV